MYHSLLIHSSADGHLGCFHVLCIINSAAMNIEVHVSLSDLVSSVCMTRSGIVGSYGSSISSFSRNPHTVLHSGCTSLHFHQQCKRIPITCQSEWLHSGFLSQHIPHINILLQPTVCGYHRSQPILWCLKEKRLSGNYKLKYKKLCCLDHMILQTTSHGRW